MRYILAIFIFVILASNAFCEDAASEKNKYIVSVGLGVMDGHTTYQIGGHFEAAEDSGRVRFPLSELEFPLDIYYGSLFATVDLTERWEITAGLKKNISKNAGKTKDSDWGIAYEEFDWWTDPDSLDVYSVSDTKTDALVLDISARFYFNPLRFQKSELLFYFGGKYVYQKFEFTASNLDQWYPSLNDHFGSDRGHDYISGKVLTYDITKHILAAIAGTRLVTGPNLALDVMFGYSPAATLKDEDHHLIRSPILVSKSDCDGDAFLFALICDFRFSKQWSLGIKYDYTYIDTDGEEKQYQDGEYFATIDQKNFSDLHAYEMLVSYRF